MTDYLTYCAQARLLRLIEDGGATAVRLISPPRGSMNFELMFTTPQDGDIMLTSTPRIFTDLHTLRMLNQASVDFDYPSAEFVITRDIQ